MPAPDIAVEPVQTPEEPAPPPPPPTAAKPKPRAKPRIVEPVRPPDDPGLPEDDLDQTTTISR